MPVTSPCYLGYLKFFSRGNHLNSVVAQLSGQRYLVTPVTSNFFIYTVQLTDREFTFTVAKLDLEVRHERAIGSAHYGNPFALLKRKPAQGGRLSTRCNRAQITQNSHVTSKYRPKAPSTHTNHLFSLAALFLMVRISLTYSPRPAII